MLWCLDPDIRKVTNGTLRFHLTSESGQTPFEEPQANGPEATVGGIVARLTTRSNRDASGRFTAGNTAALRHGRRSTVVRRRIEVESRAELAERRQAILNDLGGADGLSTIATDVLERYLVAAALLQWMEDRMIVEGVVTGKGKRRAIHRAYLAQLDWVVRLGSMLGLERRAKPVPTIEQYVREQAAKVRREYEGMVGADDDGSSAQDTSDNARDGELVSTEAGPGTAPGDESEHHPVPAPAPGPVPLPGIDIELTADEVSP